MSRHNKIASKWFRVQTGQCGLQKILRIVLPRGSTCVFIARPLCCVSADKHVFIDLFNTAGSKECVSVRVYKACSTGIHPKEQLEHVGVQRGLQTFQVNAWRGQESLRCLEVCTTLSLSQRHLEVPHDPRAQLAHASKLCDDVPAT